MWILIGQKRIDLCRAFMKQIECYPEIFEHQKNFKLTSQEMCTVVAMEFFVTPALEITEVMSNLITDLEVDDTDLIQKISCNVELMRYAVIASAHRYPVLQSMFREISYKDMEKNVTPCSNPSHDTHVLEIQTAGIAESIRSDSLSNDINRYITSMNNENSTISEQNTCMAFGKGPRICKGKELAIKIITEFLTTFYTELNQWPHIEISAGRKYAAFDSPEYRLYRWNRRSWIAKVLYRLDIFLNKTDLERFQCQF